MKAVCAVGGALLFFAGCGGWGHGVEGRVLEVRAPDNSVVPLAYAFVIVTWEGEVPGLVGGQTVVLHTSLTLTDANGRYEMRGWIGMPRLYPVIDVIPSERIYRHGFKDSRIPFGFIPNLHDFVVDTKAERFTILTTDDDPPEARFDWLERFSDAVCVANRKETLMPVCREIFEEAAALPPFPETNPHYPSRPPRKARLQSLCERAGMCQPVVGVAGR